MILQKEIQTSKAIILVIGGLPEDAPHVGTIDDTMFNHLVWGNNPVRDKVVIPYGEWQPIGFLKDITEDVAKQIIPYVNELVGYMDYAHNNNISFDIATESLQSLIEANCKFKNKYGSIPLKNDERYRVITAWKKYLREDLQKWKEEQSQVFTNPFLLKKA